MDQKGALVVDLSWIVVALPSLYQGVKFGPWRFHWHSARLEVASIAVLLVSNVPAITVSAWLCDAGRAWLALVPVVLPLAGTVAQAQLAQADRIEDEQWQQHFRSRAQENGDHARPRA